MKKIQIYAENSETKFQTLKFTDLKRKFMTAKKGEIKRGSTVF